MKITDTLHAILPEARRDERGAALITALLTATLLLGIGGVLILTSSMSAVTTVDSTAEAQAYYAAEAGMEEALRALRGNGTGEKLSFKEAATPKESNSDKDKSTTATFPDGTTGKARLSKWLVYSYKKDEIDERVPLTGGTSYSPIRDLAYSVEILKPDAPAPGATPVPPSSTEENPAFNKGAYTVKDPGTDTTRYPTGRPQDTWHPQDCGHCSYDFTHCGMYDVAGNGANSGTPGMNPGGCTHDHCFPPTTPGSPGTAGDDGYQRLIVKVTGYGPKGARKEIEMLVKRTMFDYQTPALMYMQGSSSGGMTFDLSGSSFANAKDTKKNSFDGEKGGVSFGFTNSTDSTTANSAFAANPSVELKGGDPETLGNSERVEIFTSAARARDVRDGLKQVAQARKRYFTTASPPGSIGSPTNMEFTFVEGNYTLTGTGGGLLVVTGKLTLSGAFTFDGLILVLGDGALTDGGTLIINGHATNPDNSYFRGSLALAKLDGTAYSPPTFRITGGKAKLEWNKDVIKAAVNTVGATVLGVREH